MAYTCRMCVVLCPPCSEPFRLPRHLEPHSSPSLGLPWLKWPCLLSSPISLVMTCAFPWLPAYSPVMWTAFLFLQTPQTLSQLGAFTDWLFPLPRRVSFFSPRPHSFDGLAYSYFQVSAQMFHQERGFHFFFLLQLHT